MADVEVATNEVEPSNEPTEAEPGPTLAYAEHAAELRRFILGVLGDPSGTDDVMQLTFLKAVERGHEARIGTAKGWLFQVAYREALTLRRRQVCRDQIHRKLAHRSAPAPPAPDEAMIRSETVEAVRKALAGLPETQRRVVLARMADGKTFAEIARGDGLPLGTVLSRMRRALQKLKQDIDPGA